MTAPVILSSRGRPMRELFGITSGGLGSPQVPQPVGLMPARSLTIVGNMGALDSGAVERMPLGAFGAGPSLVGLPNVAFWTSGYTIARLVGEVRVAGAAGSVILVECRDAGTSDTFVSAGVTPIALPLDATGLVTGAWAVRVAGSIDDTEFRFPVAGGDGIEAPVLGNLYLQLAA